MVPLLVPILLIREDYYLNKCYSGTNLTEFDKSSQVAYYELIVSIVASSTSNTVKVTCEVLDQEVIDNLAVPIEESFEISKATNTLTYCCYEDSNRKFWYAWGNERKYIR